MEQWTGSKLGKEYVKAVYCHLAYLTYMQCTSCKMLGSMKHKLESIFAGRNINNLRYADDTTLKAENEEELKILLMKVKQESGKAGLKCNIQKTKIMASGPITSWQTGKKMETVMLYFLGLENHWRWWLQSEIKRQLILGRKTMTYLHSRLKGRDITERWTNKGPSSQLQFSQ